MASIARLLARPFGLVVRPVERLIKGKLAGLIDDRLGPVRAELKAMDAKMDRILDLNVAPDVLKDFRVHNETLRAIRADCDLLRDLDPLFNTMLRDLMRLELRCEELAHRLDREPAGDREAA